MTCSRTASRRSGPSFLSNRTRPGPSMLAITDLSKVYPTGAKALNQVSFTVDDPQVIAHYRSFRGRQEHPDPLHQPAGGTQFGKGHAGQHRCRLPETPGVAQGAAAHGHDLSGIQSGGPAHGDGEPALRTAGIRLLLAGLPPEIPPPGMCGRLSNSSCGWASKGTTIPAPTPFREASVSGWGSGGR